MKGGGKEDCSSRDGFEVVLVLVDLEGRLVLVVLDEEALVPGGASDSASRVLADGGGSVGLGSLQELGLACLHVLAAPRLQGRRLQSAAVAEGERPGLSAGRALVDGVQVHRRLLLGLAAGEEADAGHGGGHGAGQGQDGGLQRGELCYGLFYTNLC